MTTIKAAFSLNGNLRRGHLVLVLLAAVIFSSVAGAIPAAAQSLPLFTVSPASAALRTVDPLTGATLTTVTIALSGQTVVGANGLARQPSTGVLFAILRLTGVTGRVLVTINPTTGAATLIGNTGLLIDGITFGTAAGTLFAVTADTDPTSPETLFTLSTTNGLPTLRVVLGNGSLGEAIAFNPADGLIYHLSGATALNNNAFGPILETINLATFVVTNIPISGDLTTAEVLSIVHWSGDMFLVTNTSNNSFILKTNGQTRTLSLFNHSAKGVVFAGTPPACPPLARLYGAANIGSNGPSLFYTINQASGAATLIGPIGFERVSGMDFNAAGVLFGAGERQDGTNQHAIFTINPCTGLGSSAVNTNVTTATTGDVFSDMSFRPSDGTLFAYVEGNDQLATVATATGAVTLRGSTIVAVGLENGMAFSSTSTLFHAAQTNLNTLNQTTGLATPVAALVFPAQGTSTPRMAALAFDPATGTLFGSMFNGTPATGTFLTTINTTTAAVTNIGATGLGMDAIAFNSQVADLSITKTASSSAPLLNNTLTYTVTVTNNGPAAATAVTVVDVLPPPAAAGRPAIAGFTVTSVTPSQGVPAVGTACTGTTVRTCTLGTIASGASATITIVGTVTAIGSLVNTATVSSALPDSNTANNSATSTLAARTITVVVAPTSTTVRPGTNGIYEVVVRGSGGAVSATVALSCVNITGPVTITCSFNPASGAPGSATFTSVLTVSTGGGTAFLGVPPSSQPQAPLYAVWLGLPMLAFFGMLAFSGRRKRLAYALALGLLLMSLLPLASCNSAEQAVPPSTVTFGVRGTVGTLTVTSSTVTLLVDSR